MCWAQGHPAGQSLRPIWNLNSSSFTQSVRGQETCNGLPTRLGEDVVGGDPSLPGSANQEPVRSSRSLLPASWVRVGGRGAGSGEAGNLCSLGWVEVGFGCRLGVGQGQAADTAAMRGSHHLYTYSLDQTSHLRVISVSSSVNSRGQLCSSNTLSLHPPGL